MSQQQISEDVKSKFHKALLDLHKDVEAMVKDEKNPYYKSKYVPLPKMIKYLKPILTKRKFILSQPVDVANTQNGIRNVVITRLVHTPTSLSDESKMVIPEINDMQKLGGCVTYARRYTLSAVLGLEESDDDGNTASGKNIKPAKKASGDLL